MIIVCWSGGKDSTAVYVGIAYDEKHRRSKNPGKIKYPLIEWEWTDESDSS